jgi:hypothetical protein
MGAVDKIFWVFARRFWGLEEIGRFKLEQSLAGKVLGPQFAPKL